MVICVPDRLETVSNKLEVVILLTGRAEFSGFMGYSQVPFDFGYSASFDILLSSENQSGSYV